MTKTKLKETIVKISKMNKQQLIDFSQKVYLNKHEIKPKVFKFLQQALDIQMMNLQDATGLNAMCVMSELKEGEL